MGGMPGPDKHQSGPLSQGCQAARSEDIAIGANAGVDDKARVLITPPEFFADFSIALPSSSGDAVHAAFQRYVAIHFPN